MNFIRNLLLAFTILFSGFALRAQAPQLINYQAVARDAAGVPLINTAVNVLYEIRQSSPTGTVVYSETHATTTNQFGLFTLEIGGGSPVSGTFAGINWSTGLYYLRVTVNGDVMAPSQLLSVPYALHANTATSGSPGANGHNALADSVAEPAGTNCPNGGYLINMGADDNDDGILQPLEYDISYYICNGLDGAANNNDTSATNELQTLSISNDTIFLSNGGFVVLPSGAGDGDWQVTGNDMSTIPVGNVGIGTPTPQRKLAIESASATGDGLLINNSSTGNPGLMFQTQGNPRFVMGVDQSDNDKFKIGTTNIFTNTRFTINQFGKVGIGTTNPTQQLTVASLDTIVASFIGTNTNGAAISVAALNPNAPVGALYLSGTDTGFTVLDPIKKTMFVANSRIGGHVSMFADSSASMSSLVVANIGGDKIINSTRAMYNNADTIYSYSASGSILSVNQGSFYTDSLYVLGGTSTAGYVLTSNGFGKAEWQAPAGGSLWQSNSPDIYFNTGKVGIGTSVPSVRLHIQNGTMRIDNGTNPYTFPTGDGAANEVLTTDGAGNVSWQPVTSGSNQWSILGNSGTVDGVNFIGTMDAVPLNFRVNNITAGRIDPTLSNVFFGDNTASGISTGGLNTIVGSSAGFSFSTGNTNTLIGGSAGFSNISGNANTMIGYYAGYLTTGSLNTFVGEQSAANNTTGERNAFLGRNAGLGNTTGNNSVFLGYEAGMNNVNGSNNVALGYNAGPATGSLVNAAAIGANAVVNTSNSIVLGNNANVGIGTSSPTATLDVNGTFKLTDGSQGAGKILTSDATGNASWQPLPAPINWNVTTSTNGIPAGTTTPVIFSNIEYVNGGGYNSGTGMFQAPVEGIYHVDATVTFDASATNHEIQIQILRNGGTYKTVTLYNDPTKSYVTAHISGDVYLPVNNTVAIGIFQNSGGTMIPTTASSTARVYFNGHLVH